MNHTQIWTVIVLLGGATYLVRYSFLGLVGDRGLPEWVLRHLRYTPVAVIPGLVAPAVFWPAATEGVSDPARLCAAAATLALGMVFRSAFAAILGGVATLYLGLWLTGQLAIIP